MKGSEVIKIIGVEKIHCSVGKEMLDIDAEYDYAILKGTQEHPRVVCEHHEKMIEAGKYSRLRVEGRDVINDVEWTTGHNTFEGRVEPGFSPERPSSFVIK